MHTPPTQQHRHRPHRDQFERRPLTKPTDSLHGVRCNPQVVEVSLRFLLSRHLPVLVDFAAGPPDKIRIAEGSLVLALFAATPSIMWATMFAALKRVGKALATVCSAVYAAVTYVASSLN